MRSLLALCLIFLSFDATLSQVSGVQQLLQPQQQWQLQQQQQQLQPQLQQQQHQQSFATNPFITALIGSRANAAACEPSETCKEKENWYTDCGTAAGGDTCKACTSPNKCPKGSFACLCLAVVEGSKCTPKCELGMYREELASECDPNREEAVECKKCPADTFDARENKEIVCVSKESCLNCPAGKHSSEGSSGEHSCHGAMRPWELGVFISLIILTGLFFVWCIYASITFGIAFQAKHGSFRIFDDYHTLTAEESEHSSSVEDDNVEYVLPEHLKPVIRDDIPESSDQSKGHLSSSSEEHIVQPHPLANIVQGDHNVQHHSEVIDVDFP